jgi:hypothetical protein
MKARRLRSRMVVVWAVGLALAVVPAARGAQARGASIVASQAARRTATVRLDAGSTRANEGLNFDGQAYGRLVVTVPLGWRVVVRFANLAALPHSLVVEPWREPSDLPHPYAAFAGAATPDPYAGTRAGGRAGFAFVASRTGRYRLACAVPGHRDLGMWAVLVVTKAARTAFARIVP